MKAIITRANPDKTFDEVGMRNRTISSGSIHKLRRVARAFSLGRPVRIEYYDSTIYAKPSKTETLK